jgi:hypothetical protein
MPVTSLPSHGYSAHTPPASWSVWDVASLWSAPPPPKPLLSVDQLLPPAKRWVTGEEDPAKRVRLTNGAPQRVPLALPVRLQLRFEQEGVAGGGSAASDAAARRVAPPRKLRVPPVPPPSLRQRLWRRLPTPPTAREVKGLLGVATRHAADQLCSVGRVLLEASARELVHAMSHLAPPPQLLTDQPIFMPGFPEPIRPPPRAKPAAPAPTTAPAAGPTTTLAPTAVPRPVQRTAKKKAVKPPAKVSQAAAKAQPQAAPASPLAALPTFVRLLPVVPPKALDVSVDPKTGIYCRFLAILHPPDPTKPKKTEPRTSTAKRVVLYKPDPEDKLFPTPPIIAEPAAKKKARKSPMLKWLTDSDLWKLENFFITWDCTTCHRTFLDRERLQKHKGDCSGEMMAQQSSLDCQYCQREFPSEQVLTSHKQHTHGDRKEVKQEIQVEKLRSDVEKVQKWVDECDIDCIRIESCMNTLHQLNDTLIMMMVYLASRDNATRQLAGREMMVMVDIAVKASALGCSTSAVSVADITSANPTVVAGLFHAIAHLEGYGLLPPSLRQQVDDTRRKRNIVFHTLGVVLDEEGLQKQSDLALTTLRWSQLLMDRTLNVCQSRDPSLPPKPKLEPVVIKIDPNAPRLPNGALASGPIPYVPPGVQTMGNQSGIPAWKYTAPEIPILNLANVLLGSQPTLKPVAKPGQL